MVEDRREDWEEEDAFAKDLLEREAEARDEDKREADMATQPRCCNSSYKLLSTAFVGRERLDGFGPHFPL